VKQIGVNLESMSTHDLWSLHQRVIVVLTAKMAGEKTELEKKLGQLKAGPANQRRYYPPVLPKYRNPMRPSETWAGRGKLPRWLSAQLRKGKRVEDFRIRGS